VSARADNHMRVVVYATELWKAYPAAVMLKSDIANNGGGCPAMFGVIETEVEESVLCRRNLRGKKSGNEG